MKKLISIMTSLVLVLSLFACGNKTTGGAADTNGKITYAVKFYDGEDLYYETTVEQGRRIEIDVVDPTNEDSEKSFTGWYKESGCTTAWNFEVDTVTKDTSLYAGWKTVSATPSALCPIAEGLRSGLTWTQLGASASMSVSVNIYPYLSTTTTEGVDIDNYSTTATAVSGTVTVSEETVTWLPTSEPAGGKYKVSLKVGEFEVLELEGVWFKGEGSLANPYLITDEEDLNVIRYASGTVGEGKNYKLARDISITTDYNQSKDGSFAGTIDGNGYVINISETGNSGIFYDINAKGIVQNFNVIGSISTAAWPSIGTIANHNHGKIVDSVCYTMVTSTVDVVAKPSDKALGGAGGIVGTNEVGGVVLNSSYSGTTAGGSADGVLKATNGGGGIAGTNYGTITGCVNKGCLGAYNAVESGKSLSAYSYMGGIAGYNYGKIEKSGTESIGKLLAQRALNDEAALELNNIAIGGVVGYNAENATVELCYFEGIRVHGDEAVGGICGINAGTIDACYASGMYFSSLLIRGYVGGRKDVGGICGRCEATSVITNCFNTANVYAYSTEAYAIASSATNSVANKLNNDANTANSVELGQTPKATNLVAPTGTGNILIDNTPVTDADVDATIAEAYLDTLGSDFAYSSSLGTIRFAYELTALGNSYSIHFYDGETKISDLVVFEVPTETTKSPTASKDGYILLGYSLTTTGEVVLEANVNVTYSTFSQYILEGTELSLYAIYEEDTHVAEPTDALVIGYLTANGITEELANNLKTGFLAYCEANSISVTTITLKAFDDSKLADFTAKILADETIDIVLGTGNNINTSDSSLIKDNVNEKLALNITTNSGRYAVSLTTGANELNAASFLDFIETEAAAAILNPPVEDEGTDALVVAIYDRYVTAEIAAALKTAFEAYLVSEEITGVTVTFTHLVSTSVADAVQEVQNANPAIDVILGGGNNIGSTEGSTSGVTLVLTNTDVTISTAARKVSIISECSNLANATTFVEYLLTEAGALVINPVIETTGTDALVVGIFDRYVTAEISSALKTAFEAYLASENITGVTVTFTHLTSTGVADVVDEVKNANPAIDVILGGGGNIGSTAGTVSLTTLTLTSTDVVISDSTRKVSVITDCVNSENAQTFVAYLATEAGKAVVNPVVEEPEPDPEPETGTSALVVGIFDAYVPTEIADALKTAFEAYLVEQNITGVTVIFTHLTSSVVSDVVDEVQTANPAIDVVLGGGGNIGTKTGTVSGTALVLTSTDVTISGAARKVSVITNCANSANAQTFVTYLGTTAGALVINPAA